MKRKSEINWGIYIYAAILIFINIIRVFDNNFWGDEVFSIKLANFSLFDMLKATAQDVHPPLYYLVLSAFTKILGNHGWVYHFVSVVPYLCVTFFIVSIIRKRFGYGAAYLFLSLVSLAKPSVIYNVEVRMYSLAFLMVLLAYYGLLLILENRRIGNAVFVICSLGAAYTHYYAMFSVAFFYLLLLLWAIKNREKTRQIIGIYLVTVIGYLPWLASLITSFSRTKDDFWMTKYPSILECVRYLFDSDIFLYSYGMIVITLVLTVMHVFRGKDTERESQSEAQLSIETVWMIWGLVAVFGTLCMGELISVLVRPSFLQRYLYPVMGVIWLVLCVGISKIPHRNIVFALLISLSLMVYIPSYYNIYREDRANDLKCIETQIQMLEFVREDDILLTNITHLSWTVLGYYFPGVESVGIERGYDQFDKGTRYWLLWKKELKNKDIKWLRSNGYQAKEILNNGYLGENEFYLYELIVDDKVESDQDQF